MMFCKKLFFFLAFFIIGCLTLYYGFSVSQSEDYEKINNIPWSWLMLIGLIIMVFSAFKIVKYRK